jgi:hypothetical protein
MCIFFGQGEQKTGMRISTRRGASGIGAINQRAESSIENKFSHQET